MRYGVDAMRCGVDAMRCGVDSMRCGVDAMRCGVDAMRCGVDAMRCGVDAMRCGVDDMQCRRRAVWTRCCGGAASCVGAVRVWTPSVLGCAVWTSCPVWHAGEAIAAAGGQGRLGHAAGWHAAGWHAAGWHAAGWHAAGWHAGSDRHSIRGWRGHAEGKGGRQT
eukprot:364797-Chlamydomonas_euryale.AAC.9